MAAIRLITCLTVMLFTSGDVRQRELCSGPVEVASSSTQPGWTEVRSPSLGFRAGFPGAPKQVVEDGQLQWQLAATRAFFSVSCTARSEVQSQLRYAFVSSGDTRWALFTTSDVTALDGTTTAGPSSGDPFLRRRRIFLVNDRVFELNATYRRSAHEASIETFLDSFHPVGMTRTPNLEGVWQLTNVRENSPAGTMKIANQQTGGISAAGDGWTGRGLMSTSLGFYNWTFNGERAAGRTILELKETGELAGEVLCSEGQCDGLNWRFIAKRQK